MISLILALASQDIPTRPPATVELTEAELTSWITRSHVRHPYQDDAGREGGAGLAAELLGDVAGWFAPTPPPPPDLELPPPTWRGVPQRLQRLSDGKVFTGVQEPLVSSWYGADHWSSSSRNRQPLKRPGDVLYLAPGDYQAFRITLAYDIDTEAIRQNPTRLGDPVGYPTRPFTYLEGGRLVYGLNNRDSLKGLWTHPTPAYDLEPSYPAWFRWGIDPQTWIVGELLDEEGRPTVHVHTTGGHTYGEWIGAVSMANLTFHGPDSGALLQAENPVAKDADGAWIENGHNWPEEPRAVRGEWQGFRDWELFNCWIEGGWDHETGTGTSAKWGFLGYELGRSARGEDVPGFRWIGGGVRGIHHEHAFYLHNTIATSPDAWAVHLKGLLIEECGRTAVQNANRTQEGPSGRGRIVIEDCTIRNVCLGDGGSALSFNGNHDGVIEVLNTNIHQGDGRVRTPNVTGCFVSHAGGGSEGRPNRHIRLVGSSFTVGPLTGEGSARRPNLQVRDVGTFELLDCVVRQADGAREAIDFGENVGALVLGRSCEVYGDVLASGQAWRDQDADGDGWDDGDAWAAFLLEIETGEDTNGDGVLVGESGAFGSVVVVEE